MSDWSRLLQLQGASAAYIAYCEACREEQRGEIHDDDDGEVD